MKLYDLLDTMGELEPFEEALKPDYKTGGHLNILGSYFPAYAKVPDKASTPALSKLQKWIKNPDVSVPPSTINLVDILQSMLTLNRKGKLQPLTAHITQAVQGGSAKSVGLSRKLLNTTGGIYASSVREALIRGIVYAYNDKIRNKDGAEAFTDFDWNTLQEWVRDGLVSAKANANFIKEDPEAEKIPMQSKIQIPVDSKFPEYGNKELQIAEFFAYTIVEYLEKRFSRIPPSQQRNKEEYVNMAKSLAEGVYTEDGSSMAELSRIRFGDTAFDTDVVPGDPDYVGPIHSRSNKELYDEPQMVNVDGKTVTVR